MISDLVNQTLEMELWAGWHQFWLQDDDISLGRDADLWNEETVRQMIVVGPRFVWIGTDRHATVPVKLIVSQNPYAKDLDKYDLVNRCGLEIQTGRIVIGGCGDYWPESRRIDVPAGYYEIRIGYGKLDTWRGNGLEGDDFYDVFVSPSKSLIETRTLKDTRQKPHGILNN